MHLDFASSQNIAIYFCFIKHCNQLWYISLSEHIYHKSKIFSNSVQWDIDCDTNTKWFKWIYFVINSLSYNNLYPCTNTIEDGTHRIYTFYLFIFLYPILFSKLDTIMISLIIHHNDWFFINFIVYFVFLILHKSILVYKDGMC